MTPLFIGYFVAYALLLVLGLALLLRFARLATVPRIYLLPMIGAISLVGAYASERTVFALALTVARRSRACRVNPTMKTIGVGDLGD